MKTKRFFSLFLILTLVMSLWATPQAAAVEDPNIQAKAALLVDVNTDSVVYAKNAHQEMYPASLTKVMTTLVVLDAIEAGKLQLDQELTASESAFLGLAADGSNAGIKPGEIMTVENLLYCVMVVSANEACNILAEAVSGDVSTFVSEMNNKAKALGCENTHFANTNGLHDPQHYTSAWDMYLITKAAMEHDLFMTIADTANVVIPATNLSKERNYWTTNHLLSTWRVIGYRNKEAHGIKTGSTDEAGYCLISSAARGSMHCVSVIMGAERV
jgi:D-alanyl-D-alanine carboxypeptidase (penicillin-binding protein 5/6)